MYGDMPGYMDPNAYVGATNAEMAAIGAARTADASFGYGYTQAQMDSLGVEANSMFGQQMAHNLEAQASSMFVQQMADVAQRADYLATQARPAPSPLFASSPRTVIETVRPIQHESEPSAVPELYPAKEAEVVHETEDLAPSFDAMPSETWRHHTKTAREHRAKVIQDWVESHIDTRKERLVAIVSREAELLGIQVDIQQRKAKLLAAHESDPTRALSKQAKEAIFRSCSIPYELEDIRLRRIETELKIEHDEREIEKCAS
jgi:hypothetical protein